MRPPMKKLNIAASTQRVDVDNRMSLRFYFRIADNMLKQANIYREENNLIDLYIILLRFSSLVSETIPKHQDYKSATVKEKNECKKKLLAAVQELEAIKPEVLRRVDEINKAHEASISQVDYGDSLEWPPRRAESISFNNGQSQGYASFRTNGALPNTWKTKEQVKDQRISSSQIDWQMNKLALNIPLPKEETLSRHSLLGPNGLRGQWQSSRPSSRVQVQYPSHGDLSPIEIPSFDQGIQNSVSTSEVSSTSTSTSVGDERLQLIDSNSVASAAVALTELSVPSIVRQPSPPPVLAPVKNMPISLENSQVSHMNVADPRPGPAKTIQDVLANSQGPRSIQISTKMMDEFMRMAKSNTQKNLETCAVLTATLKKNMFYVTTLIVPKQESTSDTCQTTNEEEIYEVQDKRSLFTVGWIHTHPSQSCFMSSVDLHTHYSYQIMLSEAIAIVMAPTDPERRYGIFHLSDPGGVTVIKKCDRRGFHPHEDTPDGSPIYEHCAHVLMSPSLKFDVVDLR